MKAYLITTGSLFGLIALMHVWRSIVERSRFATEPLPYLLESSLGLVAAALSIWAWRLTLTKVRKSE